VKNGYLIDKIAKRYGKLPTEIIKLPMRDFSFNAAVAIEGEKYDIKYPIDSLILVKQLGKMFFGNGKIRIPSQRKFK